jgi:hypothetical protein
MYDLLYIGFCRRYCNKQDNDIDTAFDYLDIKYSTFQSSITVLLGIDTVVGNNMVMKDLGQSNFSKQTITI